MSAAELISIEIENFRGIRERREFDLDAPVVLFWGPNGTGKTTLFDAFQWLLQGELPRLARQRMRKGEEFVVNSYARASQATVVAVFRIDGEVVRVSRTGDSLGSFLDVSGGSLDSIGRATTDGLVRLLSKGDLAMSELLTTSGLLQQDDLRLLLRDSPDQRYRQLLRLLGLETLEEFQRQARTWQAQARDLVREAQRTLDEQKVAVRELGDQIETISGLSEALTSESVDFTRVRDVVRTNQRTLRVDLGAEAAVELAEIGASAADLRYRAATLLDELALLPGGVEPSRAQTLKTAIEGELVFQAAVDAARERWESAMQAQAEIAASNDQFEQLVSLAIPQLSHAHVAGQPTECPVCRTPIDAEEVIRDLQSRSLEGAASALVAKELANSRSELSGAEALLRSSKATREQLESAERTALGHESRARNIVGALGSLRAGRVSLISPELRVTDDARVEPLPWLISRSAALVHALRITLEPLVQLEDASATASRRASATGETARRSSNLPRLIAQRESLQAALGQRQIDYEDARRREQEATLLTLAAATATQEIFRERFETLEPLMNDIYGRLDPHPTFTRLDFKVESFRSRGTATATVSDEVENVHGNPLLLFSSAQANIVVLSAFLAIGWAAGETGLPFVLMDDPLQSLDDVNVLGFADLSRELRKEKQVLLTTHEERFARMLERKLGGSTLAERVIVHQFVSWSRNGPVVESRRIGPEAADK